ncbi:hydrogenase large subunit [Candidatus Methylospira mobilis]|nr:NADH-quinone oxidoreductase subunit C [Candidatus Methylospira mobilis]
MENTTLRSRFQWLPELQTSLVYRDISLKEIINDGLQPARLFEVAHQHWGADLAHEVKQMNFRFVALWVEDGEDSFTLTACLEKQADYILLRCFVPGEIAEAPSFTPYFPAADRMERHATDLFGIRFPDHPDPRRWTRHQAWSERQFPLRKNFPVSGTPLPLTPPDHNYPFIGAQGNGVYEIPVGPVHAGTIEPGHFRFLAVGETVLNLEEHLGYVHKGIEKIAEGRDPQGLARLAGRVSGDATVAHAWAACMAMENAAGITVPARAVFLRAIFAERERIANHLGDIGGICNDVGFAFANYQFSRLREIWQRDNYAWFGHRFLMDAVVPGGVAKNIDEKIVDAMRSALLRLRGELDELRPILENNGSLQDRLVTAGYLSQELAQAFACVGYMARASGVDYDVRRDAPYPPYDAFPTKAVCSADGDVAARLHVRYEDIYAALDLLERLLASLPRQREILAAWHVPPAGAEGIGILESWRGELLCHVRFGENNRIARYYPRDPSVLNWPSLEKLIHNNIVPDFPLCNKSVNASYSGQDL